MRMVPVGCPSARGCRYGQSTLSHKYGTGTGRLPNNHAPEIENGIVQVESTWRSAREGAISDRYPGTRTAIRYPILMPADEISLAH